MNKKKIQSLIVKALAGVLVTNVALTAILDSNIIKVNANTEIEESVDVYSENVVLNENFSTIKKETDNTYKSWWKNEERPDKWQLRKWGGAAATGDNKPYGKVVEDNTAMGGKYTEVEFNQSVGFFQPDDYITIAPNETYELDLKIKNSDISTSEPLSVRVEYYDNENKVLERKDVVKITGTNDWKEYNIQIGTDKPASKMKVIFVFGNINANSTGATGTMAIDSLSIKAKDAKLEKVEFNNAEVTLGVGKKYIPSVKVFPAYSTEKYSLVSSDTSIAEIQDGAVIGVAAGDVTISALSESGKDLGSFKVTVKVQDETMYNKALDSIFETMVPNSIIDINDTQTKETIDKMVVNGDKYWKSMNKDMNAPGLWSNTTSTTDSAHITTQFNRLYDMAVAYVIEGSPLKGNKELLKDIKFGLEYMKANKYDGKKFYKNWWDWEVGAPQKLNSILILLRNDLTYDEIVSYTNIIDTYVKDPTKHTQGKYDAVGANRSDMCKVVIYSGLLSQNEDRINLGVEKLDPLFKYVDDIIAEEGKKQDGYYKDGSWIEHGSIPYAGSYGAVLIGGVGEINHILTGTPWSIPEEKMSVLYEVILDSFEPLMYKGVMMNMVSGRAISRANERDYGHGFGFMRRVLAFYTESAPPEYKDRYKAMIKEWIESNDKRDIIGNSTNLQFTVQAKALMKEDVEARGELIGNYMFPNMDRVVHRRPGYVFGLSMYSSRISNYESLNGENLKGYHTADGMTYLYNGDIEQYSKDFWPTVDSKRLPGTTVDTKDIFANVAGTSYGPGETATSMRDWVGGATLGDFGVSGMYLDNKRSNPKKDLGMDLEAKKSYFMFDDEIVALGSGITSTKDNGVETVVENRLINKESDKLYVNGKDITTTVDEETTIEDAKWAYVEGSDVNSSIGYYFPSEEKVNVMRDTRTGSWKEINNGQPADIKTNTFFTMWKDHGVNPENDTYEYVLLPNKSIDEVEEYSNKSNIEVLVNTDDVQAARETTKGMFAANFWNDKEVEIKEAGIKVNGMASVIMQENEGTLEIAVSDPTMKNTGEIVVELDKEITGVNTKDDRISVEEVDGKTVLKVNVDGTSGQSIKAEFATKVDEEKPEPPVEPEKPESPVEPETPEEKPDTEKPDGEKPDGEKPDGEKPDGEKPDGEKPDGEKPDGEKPDGEKPNEEKPDGDKKPEEENKGDLPFTGGGNPLLLLGTLSAAVGAVLFRKKK